MLTSPRIACVRRNAIPILSSSSTSWPRRRLFAPRRNLGLTARMRIRCFNWEEDENSDLEAEILEFMKLSSKPEAFPTRIELVEAGRVDLAEAIVSRGGWLSFGWDSESEEEDEKMGDKDAWNDNSDDGIKDYSDLGEAKLHDEEASSILSLYPYDTNETEEEESGIEGILSRLERQRNDSFGFDDGDSHNQCAKFPNNDTLISRSFSSNEYFSPNKSFSNDVASQTSRSWRDEIDTQGGKQQLEIEIEPTEVSEGKKLENESFIDEPHDRNNIKSHCEEITRNQLRNRLQNLELELSSVLNSVRSNGDKIASQNEGEGLSENQQQEINDAWEFQENDIMKAQDKIRSTRAKLAVLDGKMALAIIEAQRILEEKQKRVDNAQRALRLLCSTCIVWPNPASEVLLAGSFDGWVTLRKMEKNSTGLFSLWLQLYPGKYEIKFVVDGEWRLDPERPTINNNGHLNNLVIIS